MGIFQVNGLSQCPEPYDILGNDTLICPGGAMYLDAGEASSFEWSDGTIESFLMVTEPGPYSVVIHIQGCDDPYTDEIVIGLAENPDIAILLPIQDYYCKGDLIDLTVEDANPTGTIIYEWVDNSSTEATIQVDTTGNYTVIATNEYGCQTDQNVNVEFQYPYQEDKILLSSYDQVEDKLFVVWQTTPNRRSESYSVVSGLEQKNPVGSRTVNETNILVDYETDPHLNSNYYNVTLTDSCGNASDLRLGEAHKPMFLEVSETAEGYTLLSWERYIGFDYELFYIYRGTENTNLTLLDSVQNRFLDKASFLDDSAEPGVEYFYQISVKTPETIYLNDPGGKKAQSGPFVHSFSNLEDNRFHGTGLNSFQYLSKNLNVYPNPFSDLTTISYSLELVSELKIEIFDILGKKILTLFEGKQTAGDYSINYYPTTDICLSGIYYLRIEIEGASVLTKMLIQK